MMDLNRPMIQPLIKTLLTLWVTLFTTTLSEVIVYGNPPRDPGARAWLKQSAITLQTKLERGSARSLRERDLLLAERGWILYHLGESDEAQNAWRQSHDPLAKLGAWLMLYHQVSERAGDLRGLGELIDDRPQDIGRVSTYLEGSTEPSKTFLIAQYHRLLDDTYRLLTPHRRTSGSLSRSQSPSELSGSTSRSGVTTIQHELTSLAPDEEAWRSSLIWSALLMLNDRAPSRALQQALIFAERRWRSSSTNSSLVKIGATPKPDSARAMDELRVRANDDERDDSSDGTIRCDLAPSQVSSQAPSQVPSQVPSQASNQVSHHISPPTLLTHSSIRRYRCQVTAPCRWSGGVSLALLNPWVTRQIKWTQQSRGNQPSSVQTVELSAQRGPMWWFDSVKLNSLCVNQTDAPNERIQLLLSAEASRPPQLAWLLTPPSPPRRTFEHAPQTLRDLWREMTRATRSGNLSSIYLRDVGWGTRISTLSSLWPRAASPMMPSHSRGARYTTQVSMTSAASERESQRSLITRVNHLAVELGPAHAARSLSRALALARINKPSTWSTLSLLRRDTQVKEGPKEGSKAPFTEELIHDSVDDPDELLWLLADLLIASGEAMDHVIPPLLALRPDTLRSIQWLIARPDWSPVASARARFRGQLELDPEVLIKRHKQKPWSTLRVGNMGQLFDHQTMYLLPSGAGVRWVTEVIRVNNKRGVEDFGEVKLPEGAQLIELYQRKSRGGYRAPLELLATGGYSLSDLQIGDYLIARYIEPIESERYAESVLTAPISLVDEARAVDLKVVEVYLARGASFSEREVAAPRVWVAPRDAVHADEYQVEADEHGDVSATRVIVRRARPIKRESSSPALILDGPTIQVGAPLDPLRERRDVYLYLRRMIYADEGLCDRASAFLGSSSRPSVEALAKLTRSRIQREESLLDSASPAQALARGVGHRGMTLSALMSDCGYQHELWLARPMLARHHPPTETLEHFNHLLIRWGELWIGPNSSGRRSV